MIERMPGLDFYLDPSIVKSSDAERIRSVLKSISVAGKKQPKFGGKLAARGHGTT